MKKYVFLFTMLALLGAPACGQTAPGTAESTKSAAAAGAGPGASFAMQSVSITDFAGRQVAFDHIPGKIAALGNGEMDIIYALGGTLVGRPASAAPLPVPEAKAVEQIGSVHGLDLEKVAYLSPDVVLGNNPTNMKDIASIESLGSKLVLTNADSIGDIKRQIELLGQLLQKNDKAKEWLDTIDRKLNELKTSQPAEKPRVLMVYGAPGTYMAALNSSLSGSILTAAGGENIASDYPKLDSYPQYAQLNTEKIMKSNPQIILIMTHGNPAQVKDGFLKEMQQNAAWNSLDAVKNNRVEVLPSDLFGTNPGTKIIEALDLMNKLLLSVKSAT
ncbi:ABC transporter substrate-binding protein [Paenibacillus piri]|uniref:ABC transporter substrate-binding protein n=1 Tax=Paenibacillus piri TaxID=2547395 RepID=A0A4R5K9B2_9BACL|nr:ABC transporter substrate-binding protein [Paenibacillus piri]TDF91733.1 ABC transporter substrate-binding protein [Paenibacillus piri]